MTLKPYFEILKLVWPLALGMINNALMQFVDRAFLAQDSMASLEAVLPASLLCWIFASFFQSVVGYAGVFVAQYHGAGEDERCHDSYRAAVWIALAAGALMLPIVPLGNWILALTAPSAAVVALERTYFDIVTVGSVCIYGQMAAASYFTGRGATRIVFWVNLLGNVLNAALDPFLIFGWCGCPKLGIAGAAYATVFSMLVQWAVLALAVRRQGVALASSDSGELRALVRRILRFGIPSGGYSVLNILSFTVFVFVTGKVGDLAFAVSNACFTVNYLLFAPMEGFALGVQTLVGQARGRSDNAAAFLALRRTMLLGLGFVSVCCLFVIVFYRPILAVFAPPEISAHGEFLSLGLCLLCLMAAWMLFDAADVILSGALKGAGDTKFVMWWILFNSFVLWLPQVFVVRAFHNTMPALWATMILYVVVLCIGSTVRWRRGRWRRIDMTGRDA